MTKLGPISATFAGSAQIARDATNWAGTIVGAGSDGGSGSRTRGEIVYRLESVDQDEARRVHVSVIYNLQGALAQFSRSAWRRTLPGSSSPDLLPTAARKLAGEQPAATDDAVGIGRLLWLAVREQLRRMFRLSA